MGIVPLALEKILLVLQPVISAVLFLGRKRYEPSFEDKAACLTMIDLARLGYQPPVDPAAEKWTGSRGRFDRSRIVEYSCEYVERTACSLESSIEVLTCDADASLSYGARHLVSRLHPMRQIVDIEESGGRAVLFDILGSHSGYLAGSYFSVRTRRAVLSVILIGPRFDDVEEWRGVVREKIGRMESLRE